MSNDGRPKVRDDVALRAGYHSPQLDVDVRLNANESPLPPPPEFGAAVQLAIADMHWNRYPDRFALDLRAAIGARYGRPGAQVYVANGSNEVFQTLLLTFGGPGRRAAIFEPTYAMHAQIATMTSTAVVNGRRGPDFGLDLDEVARVVDEDDPHVLFLCSPNNPTGRADPPATVERVLELVKGRRTLVVVDEAYGQFSSTSATGLVGDDVPLVVTRTFSKTWSMAAARLGYLLGPAGLVEDLFAMSLPYHVDAVKQAAGRIALEYGAEMDARVATVIEERERMSAALADLPVELWPSESSYILFRPTARGGDETWQALVDRSVLIRNCASWPSLDGCLRVTVGTASENDRFLDALGDVLGPGAP